MAISDHNYNTAKAILTQAGSNSAAASHNKHTQGKGSPLAHGRSLLAEARDEFRRLDAGQGNLQSDMTVAHYNAVHAAARQMNVTVW